LRFNLQMLMLKAHHGWSDTSFNDLLRILAGTYPEGNKVPANTSRAKKMIRPVAMKLKSSTPALTSVSYIKASMRTCRAVRTAARVDTRGMLVVAQMRMTRDDPQVGQRRRRPRSRSHLLRTRKKRVTCRGKVLHCQCGTFP
jgi:hypothetical protein